MSEVIRGIHAQDGIELFICERQSLACIGLSETDAVTEIFRHRPLRCRLDSVWIDLDPGNATPAKLSQKDGRTSGTAGHFQHVRTPVKAEPIGPAPILGGRRPAILAEVLSKRFLADAREHLGFKVTVCAIEEVNVAAHCSSWLILRTAEPLQRPPSSRSFFSFAAGMRETRLTLDKPAARAAPLHPRHASRTASKTYLVSPMLGLDGGRNRTCDGAAGQEFRRAERTRKCASSAGARALRPVIPQMAWAPLIHCPCRACAESAGPCSGPEATAAWHWKPSLPTSPDSGSAAIQRE